MDWIKKNINLVLGLFTLLGLLLFSFYFLRPQFRLIQNKTAIINEQKSQMASRKQILESQDAVSEKREQLKLRLTGMEKSFFVPFLHEKILLRITSLFGEAGMKILTMNFNEPEQVKFEGDEVLGDSERISPQQYLQEATGLMEEGVKYEIPEELADADFGISRTSLVIMFQAESSEKLIQFLNRSEDYKPDIRISSLELSSNQTAWVGHMTLHFYALPGFSWHERE